MRTLTKLSLSKAPEAAPLSKAPEAAPEGNKEAGADVSAESTVARHELDGRIKGDGPLARDTVHAAPHPHAQAHESAVKHVTGRAAYIDDLKAPADTLHVALGLSPVAHGRLTRLDLDKVRGMPGRCGRLP